MPSLPEFTSVSLAMIARHYKYIRLDTKSKFKLTLDYTKSKTLVVEDKE
jgi:hypothetical protein